VNKIVTSTFAEAQNGIFDKHKVYLDSVKEEPHPIRIRKGIGLLAKEGVSLPFDEMMREAKEQLRIGSFIDYRQNNFVNKRDIASTDNLYVTCDDPKIFIVEDELSKLLRNTALRGADFEDLRLPFRTIYIKLPQNEFKVWMPGDTGELEGVYVSEDRSEDGVGSWLLFVLVSKQLPNRVFLDDVLFSMPIPFENGPLEAQVEKRIEELQTRRNLHPEEEWANVGQFMGIFRWIVNIVLYITSSGADLKRGWYHEKTAATMKSAKGGRKRQIRHTLELMSSEVTWVGRNIRIDRREPTTERGSLDGERKSPTLHWVHGFWRNQAHGKGRSLRKHAWIAPFLRGEGREVVEKMYAVGPKEEPCKTHTAQEKKSS